MLLILITILLPELNILPMVMTLTADTHSDIEVRLSNGMYMYNIQKSSSLMALIHLACSR